MDQYYLQQGQSKYLDFDLYTYVTYHKMNEVYQYVIMMAKYLVFSGCIIISQEGDVATKTIKDHIHTEIRIKITRPLRRGLGLLAHSSLWSNRYFLGYP